MWSGVEQFLRSRGHAEEEIARIVEIARREGLDEMKINRVIAAEREEEYLH
jgi:hypothetical protein